MRELNVVYVCVCVCVCVFFFMRKIYDALDKLDLRVDRVMVLASFFNPIV
jgi:hypothetical protein